MAKTVMITVLAMIAAATADPLVVSSSFPWYNTYAPLWSGPSAALQTLPAAFPAVPAAVSTVPAALPPVVPAAYPATYSSSSYNLSPAIATNSAYYSLQNIPVYPEVASPLLSYNFPYESLFYKR